ncbi:unnamed protein product [Mesocestoides corti]|uniref:Uncharacterized protein n=1 Tax=Mesocestoides corti TaxID=53468 RepID=A0A0R3U1Y6_MESCO|nr:unnamed protein product [Mesocestoides corti]
MTFFAESRLIYYCESFIQFQCRNLLECLSVQNSNSTRVSRTSHGFRRVNTFCEGQQNTSLLNLANESEYTSIAFQAFSQAPLWNVPALQSPDSHQSDRLISQDPLAISGTNLSESVFSSRCQNFDVSTCQTPPKLKFGQSISEVHSIEKYRGSSAFSHSVLIERLARMNKCQPSGELIRRSSASQSALGDGSRSHSISRVRKSGVIMTPSFIPSTSPPIILVNDLERGDTLSSVSSSMRDEKKSSWAHLFDGDVDLPITHNFVPDSDYQLKKLSTQMEVEHLRSILRAATPKSRKSSLDYFSLKNKSGSFSSLAFRKYSCTSVPKIDPEHAARNCGSVSSPTSLQPPSPLLPTVQDSPAIESSPVPKSKNTSAMTCRFSHREHNILAPLSF